MTTSEVTIEEKQTSGFRQGMGRVGSDYKRPLIDDLMHAFGITTTPAFYKRVNAETPLTPLEVEYVEKRFLEIKITQEDIWDLYLKPEPNS